MFYKKVIQLLFLFFSIIVFAQEEGFRLTDKTKSETISFQFVKNLLIIPVEVNGQPMNFIIDSGLKETILFSKYHEAINSKDLKEIKLKGLGSDSEGSIGYLSSKNLINIGNRYYNPAAQIIIIQDQNFDLFSRLGLDVHGIIGYEFFRNYPIKIDFISQKITIYQSKSFIKNQRKYDVYDLHISRDKKPYINIDFTQNQNYQNQKMLIDLGNSDGLWIFKTEYDKLSQLQNPFYDELGKGFNGSISGERGTIYQLTIGKYHLNNPLVAIPEPTSIQFLKLENNRKGSLGNEILRRFTLILDYNDQKIYLRKNRNFDQAFHFNRSGLTIVHANFEWKKESIQMKMDSKSDNAENNTQKYQMQYQFVMNPIYKIESIRKNSNAEKIGLKVNDQLVALNGKKTSKMTLTDIENFMLNNEHQSITIEILRNNQPMKFQFLLEIPYENQKE